MNTTQASVCFSIFRELIKRSFAKLFWDNLDSVIHSQMIHPILLFNISERLANGFYWDRQSFVKELLEVLEKYIFACPKDLFRITTAKSLFKTFKDLVEEYNIDIPNHFAEIKLLELDLLLKSPDL
jgi:hypothetical protein